MILRICNKPMLAALIALCLGAFLELAAGEEPAAEDPGFEVRVDYTYGLLGPRRAPVFIAGELMATRFQIKGLSTSRDDPGVRFSIRAVIKNEKNELVESAPPTEVYSPLALGGNIFTHTILMPVSSESPAGKYSAEVIVTDQLNNKTIHSDASFILPQIIHQNPKNQRTHRVNCCV